jgi:GT2 family glycosyltransferase
MRWTGAAVSPESAAPVSVSDPTSDLPMWVGELELLAPRAPKLQLPDGRGYRGARLLIRAKGIPVGFLNSEAGEGQIDLDEVAAVARTRFAEQIVLAGGTESSDWLTSQRARVSVILCTRNRPEGARACVEAIQTTRHPALEIIVVDNAPSDDRTQSMVAELAQRDSRVRYIREPRPGLSVARNRGVGAALGEIVAFTDDDVIVDPLWLNGLLRGFHRGAQIGCVTGIVVTASLLLPAERYFDRRVWWSSSCAPAVYGREPGPSDSAMHPYASGKFGTGANFAFRRDAILAIGGFDNSLGAGSLTQGGEDLDAFVRLLRAGYGLCYEPAAVVLHHHRVDIESLVRQMRGYGLGLGAYLTKYLLAPATRGEMVRRIFQGLAHARRLAGRSAAASDDSDLRRAVLRAELTGLLAGPLAYLRSRSRQERAHTRAVSP